MCNFSRLVAWMDRELPDNEAADVERHVRDCSECRRRVQTYEQVSRELAVYCDAVAGNAVADKMIGKRTRRKMPRWVPVVASAAAAAVLILVFQVFQPASVQPASVKQIPVPFPVPSRVADASPAVVLETAPRPVKKVHRGHGIRRQQTPNANWTSAEPAIQIAIPVEAMFPPGAVPEGITFIADLSIASDGSVQGLRLQQ
ncbi:MAG: zf-HC2 domain-containing protein [Terriglobales bacterium]